MRFTQLVGALYGLVAIVFLVANSVILGMFGYKFGHGSITLAGHSIEVGKWLFAAVACCVPWALAPHLHVMAAKRRMYGRRRWVAGILGCIPFLVVYVLFVAYNMLGGTGATAFARTEQADERRHVIGETLRLNKQRDALQAQLDAITKHRPKDTVRPLIEKTKLHPFWKATDECRDQITNKGRRNFCAEIETLKAELASAEKADTLISEIKQIDEKLGDHKRVVSKEDPQVEFLADMTGFSRAQIMMILLLSTPLILEAGALYWGKQALELLNIHLRMDEPEVVLPVRRLAAGPSVARLMAASDAAEAVQAIPLSVAGSLPPTDPALQRAVYDRFWAERTRPLPGAREAALSFYSAYRSFCAQPENRVTPYDFNTFAGLSGSRGIDTSESGGVVWWLGVMVADPMGGA